MISEQVVCNWLEGRRALVLGCRPTFQSKFSGGNHENRQPRVFLALMVVLPSVVVSSTPPQKDVPAEIDSARRALQNARNDLDHAGTDWGVTCPQLSFT